MVPNAAEWMKSIPAAYLVFLIISTIATAAAIALAFVHLYAIRYYVRTKDIRNDLYYLCLIFPIVALTSLLGMYFLRSAMFLNAVAYVYVMICLLFVVMLLCDVFGGHEMFVKYLLMRKEQVRFDRSPFCCCCKFLPTILPTEQNIRYIEWMTIQSPYVRIILEIINVIAFFEQTGYAVCSVILNIFKVISMFSALYGCFILIPLGKEKTELYRITFIFRLVNLTQICLTLQMLIFETIGSFRGFGGSLLASHAKAMFWYNAVVTYEMCAMSIAATIYLHPRKCALFDKYKRYCPRDVSIANSIPGGPGRPSVTSMG
ncbi:Organic solute transporter alpha-like protein 1 [Toxocara canis]|uniref:Organic solute transporter alpha-like protein 1 n=1 Tax=Toxocara canis TaxID=6265 RepID=A0A0B2USX0_TOXCA|nr:Organic solute transporter alpha-like protein 1 [Toxocara canis]